MSAQTIDFATYCKNLRAMIRTIAEEVNASHDHPVFNEAQEESDHDEMHANLTLAYRHLEDARMRIGKAVQAFDGGASAYKD